MFGHLVEPTEETVLQCIDGGKTRAGDIIAHHGERHWNAVDYILQKLRKRGVIRTTRERGFAEWVRAE